MKEQVDPVKKSGEGNGNPLQYSCLETPMDRGAWWAVVHGVAQSRTRLKRLSMHACIGEGNGNPFQYPSLENPRDGGAWRAAICGVAQSRTQLKRLSSSSSSRLCFVLCRFLTPRLLCASQTLLPASSPHPLLGTEYRMWKKPNESYSCCSRQLLSRV